MLPTCGSGSRPSIDDTRVDGRPDPGGGADELVGCGRGGRVRGALHLLVPKYSSFWNDRVSSALAKYDDADRAGMSTVGRGHMQIKAADQRISCGLPQCGRRVSVARGIMRWNKGIGESHRRRACARGTMMTPAAAQARLSATV